MERQLFFFFDYTVKLYDMNYKNCEVLYLPVFDLNSPKCDSSCWLTVIDNSISPLSTWNLQLDVIFKSGDVNSPLVRVIYNVGVSAFILLWVGTIMIIFD